ncbi:hypothetical protein [Bacillus sp. 03113]|uniref:hypothetical protein n=1 Tax=Bacillus sp. 03113 TaxID=2578211 RepID=UPI0015E89D2D|nr:hypothetical protein [Bacillus sp. 03113]
MNMNEVPTKVLISPEVLDKQKNVSEEHFMQLVRNYLKPYGIFRLISIQGCYAICEQIQEGRETSDNKNKKSRHKRRTS